MGHMGCRRDLHINHTEILIISTYRIHRRLEVIYAVTLGAMRTLPKVDTFGLRTTGATKPTTQLLTPPTTLMTNSSIFVIEMFRDIRRFDTFTLTLFSSIL